MSIHSDRLAALREELARRNLDGFVVPLTDEHLSEYVGAYAQRLGWLTGFGGSAGTAVVLRDEAAIFIDGRYTLQVREQVEAADWSYESVPKTSVPKWLRDHAPEGSRIGHDPWLHTNAWVKAAQDALAKRNATLVSVETNPVDALWTDRPAPSPAKVVLHDARFAGRSAAEKRAAIGDWLKEHDADVAILSALDSIAWAFNIRGADVENAPVALAYATISTDGTADLFVASDKITPDVAAALGNAVRVRPRDEFTDALASFAGKRVAADPERAVAAIFETLEKGGATVIAERDPVVLPKAIKNETEIAGSRAAHLRDGAALTRFLHWLSVEAPKGGLDEIAAADLLEAFRRDMPELKDLSFPTISGAGPNGAVVHYRVDEASNRPIELNSLYLVDSGAHFEDGTTDVTRTIAVGKPTAEMRDRYTRVLKGHIALDRAIFPAGTRGNQLDVLARQYLWAVGLDYAHGTGHGVGSYLNVHEGPQRIATFGGGDEPLQPGMIVSNEPGYYKTGEYGIRFENLLLVRNCDVAGAEGEMLGFETLTLAPLDRRLIEPALLDAGERDWIDAYHARVLGEIGPQVDGAARAWLEEQCASLAAS